jgi:hypothetical protein
MREIQNKTNQNRYLKNSFHEFDYNRLRERSKLQMTGIHKTAIDRIFKSLLIDNSFVISITCGILG